jgi:transmembrane sensor
MTDHLSIEEQAASWLLHRSEPGWSAVNEEEYQQWIVSSYSHAAAAWRLEHSYANADRLKFVLPPQEPSRSIFRPSSYLLPTALAVAATAACIILWPFASLYPTGQSDTEFHATGRGQVSDVVLADGSHIFLDTMSAIETSYHQRSQVTVVRGRALFEVEKQKRPMLVVSRDVTVAVLGTKFIVDRLQNGTKVSVLEGKVQISLARNSRSPKIILLPGNVGIVRGNSIDVRLSDADTLKNGTAWLQGEVIFDETPIEEAAASFNRYSTRKIALGNVTPKHLKIGGRFKLSNIDGFVRIMNASYGLDLRVDDDRR